MMEIWWPQKVDLPSAYAERFRDFACAQTKRLVQGWCRYGRPGAEKGYMNRLALELRAYRITGNREHLLNIANYAFLEDLCPQNRKHHFDNKVGSVTRK